MKPGSVTVSPFCTPLIRNTVPLPGTYSSVKVWPAAIFFSVLKMRPSLSM